MSVELPSAPVDSIIRRRADGLRVSADATQSLARWIQDHGADVAARAAVEADADGRKTLMVSDIVTVTDRDEERTAPTDAGPDGLALPIAPVDRIARLDIPDRYRVSEDARVTLAAYLEDAAEDVAGGAARLARHADRRTIIGDDFDTYIDLVE